MTTLGSRDAVPTLRTQRLILRDWRDADLEPFARLNADPVAMEHFPSTLDTAATVELIEVIRRRWRDDGRCWWAVEELATGSFVGAVGLMLVHFDAPFHDVEHAPATEVGWRLLPSMWGRGYATEAASASVDWGFEHLGLDEIVSFTVVDNVRSRRVMERLGMEHDPAGGFEHPGVVDPESPLRQHVLYRLPASR